MISKKQFVKRIVKIMSCITLAASMAFISMYSIPTELRYIVDKLGVGPEIVQAAETYNTVGKTVYTVPQGGLYQIDLYGAGGGSQWPADSGVVAGKGGHTTLVLSLATNEKLTFFIGGKGTAGSYLNPTQVNAGGWNGGGASTGAAGSGGGATAVVLGDWGTGTDTQIADIMGDSSNADKLLAIAGGGGGALAKIFYHWAAIENDVMRTTYLPTWWAYNGYNSVVSDTAAQNPEYINNSAVTEGFLSNVMVRGSNAGNIKNSYLLTQTSQFVENKGGSAGYFIGAASILNGRSIKRQPYKGENGNNQQGQVVQRAGGGGGYLGGVAANATNVSATGGTSYVSNSITSNGRVRNESVKYQTTGLNANDGYITISRLGDATVNMNINGFNPTIRTGLTVGSTINIRSLHNQNSALYHITGYTYKDEFGKEVKYNWYDCKDADVRTTNVDEINKNFIVPATDFDVTCVGTVANTKEMTMSNGDGIGLVNLTYIDPTYQYVKYQISSDGTNYKDAVLCDNNEMTSDTQFSQYNRNLSGGQSASFYLPYTAAFSAGVVSGAGGDASYYLSANGGTGSSESCKVVIDGGTSVSMLAGYKGAQGYNAGAGFALGGQGVASYISNGGRYILNSGAGGGAAVYYVVKSVTGYPPLWDAANEVNPGTYYDSQSPRTGGTGTSESDAGDGVACAGCYWNNYMYGGIGGGVGGGKSRAGGSQGVWNGTTTYSGSSGGGAGGCNITSSGYNTGGIAGGDLQKTGLNNNASGGQAWLTFLNFIGTQRGYFDACYLPDNAKPDTPHQVGSTAYDNQTQTYTIKWKSNKDNGSTYYLRAQASAVRLEGYTTVMNSQPFTYTSGIQGYKYSIDGGPWITTRSEVLNNLEPTTRDYTVKIKAFDFAKDYVPDTVTLYDDFNESDVLTITIPANTNIEGELIVLNSGSDYDGKPKWEDANGSYPSTVIKTPSPNASTPSSISYHGYYTNSLELPKPKPYYEYKITLDAQIGGRIVGFDDLNTTDFYDKQKIETTTDVRQANGSGTTAGGMTFKVYKRLMGWNKSDDFRGTLSGSRTITFPNGTSTNIETTYTYNNSHRHIDTIDTDYRTAEVILPQAELTQVSNNGNGYYTGANALNDNGGASDYEFIGWWLSPLDYRDDSNAQGLGQDAVDAGVPTNYRYYNKYKFVSADECIGGAHPTAVVLDRDTVLHAVYKKDLKLIFDLNYGDIDGTVQSQYELTGSVYWPTTDYQFNIYNGTRSEKTNMGVPDTLWDSPGYKRIGNNNWSYTLSRGYENYWPQYNRDGLRTKQVGKFDAYGSIRTDQYGSTELGINNKYYRQDIDGTVYRLLGWSEKPQGTPGVSPGGRDTAENYGWDTDGGYNYTKADKYNKPAQNSFVVGANQNHLEDQGLPGLGTAYIGEKSKYSGAQKEALDEALFYAADISGDTFNTTYTINRDTTLYAVWEPVLITTFTLDRSLGHIKFTNGEDTTPTQSNITNTSIGSVAPINADVSTIIRPGEQGTYRVNAPTGIEDFGLSTAFDSRITDIYTHGTINDTWWDNLNPVTSENINEILVGQPHSLDRQIGHPDEEINDDNNSSILERKFYVPQYLGTDKSYDTSKFGTDHCTEYYVAFDIFRESYWYRRLFDDKEHNIISGTIYIDPNTPPTGGGGGSGDNIPSSVLDDLRTKLKIKIRIDTD